MFFKRFILGLLLYVSSVESEQIDRNFFRESESLAQCTYYSPVLDKKEKIDIPVSYTHLTLPTKA